ncbi:MAG TPA: alpha/beta fold hydrolase [Thermoleophilaceae bacterium]|nr:alpha/beta fold hydrolase [Thermoleophilaceae bacterium]
MSRSRTIFLVATGLVALHVADDSFLQPQAGTTAGDHLVSGLVPLAGLGAAVWMTARTGDGARAAIDLLLGVFGIVAGLEAVHYAREVGPTGDDFTGLLSIPAGIALIGLGLVTVWTTRDREGSLGRRVLRRTGIGLAAFVVFQFVVFPLSVGYVVTHAARPPVEHIDLGGRDTDVRFRTNDGLRLHGSYVPSRNGAAVIVAFGRKGSQPHARMLARHGYGVLIFDRRGEGHSDGDPNSYAWSDGERDLRAAVDFLQRRPDVDPGRIGGLGLSVGGETFLQAAAHDRDIRAVVSEGASARSFGELRSVPGSAPLTAATMAGITAGTAVFSNATPPPHLKDLVGRIAPRPMLLIYATEGTGGEEHTFNRAYHRAARAPKAIWEIPESGHVGGLEARPREYERRVAGFFDRSL